MDEREHRVLTACPIEYRSEKAEGNPCNQQSGCCPKQSLVQGSENGFRELEAAHGNSIPRAIQPACFSW